MNIMKKAILFGLNYPGQPGELRGCRRDAECMRDFLKEDKAYDSVRLYTSDRQTSHMSIVRKMYALAIASWREDLSEACIYYSGHGGNRQRPSWDNTSETEVDNCDEFLVPTDYQRCGVILDNKIKKILRWFNPKTRVVVIVDACHSGTMCDLKYSFDGTRSVAGPAQYRCNSNIVCVSGCKDEQCSYEAWQGEIRGVMTTALLLALQRHKLESTSDIYKYISEYVSRTGFDQAPQFSSSFDMQQYNMFI